MSQPPTAITATGSMPVQNSITALKRPISLWKPRLAVLNTSLASSKRRCCASSLAKALVVRTPDSPDSMAALMVPVFCLAARDAALICRRRRSATASSTGSRSSSTSASSQRRQNITTSAPRMVTAEMNRSSGPWCASSVSSNRSLVNRLISWPVRLRS